MRRRQYLSGIGAVLSAGYAAGRAGGSETTASTAAETTKGGPAAPVVQHYEALDVNDFKTANAAIHVDSPRGDLSTEAIEQAKKTNYKIKTTEVFDANTVTPEVHVVVEATNTESGKTKTLDLRIEVRKENGDWKMYRIVTSLPPVAQQYDTDPDDGAIDIGELGQAGIDYANGKLSISEYGRVAIAWANS